MSIERNILTALAYFDLFNYPLTRREIFLFLQCREETENFDHALNLLLKRRLVFGMEEFYALRNEGSLAERRRAGNEKAGKMLKKAHRIARIIAAFPFVKGVGISGSLSKKFADEHSDIDFFIITASNRLWLARTLLHLLKKLTYIFRLQHHLCMNYFIDESACMIREKNIYTATEVVTLMPVCGSVAFSLFYAANGWTREFLPNNYMRVSALSEVRSGWMRRIAERILNNSLGDYIDDILMRITKRRWNIKETKFRRTSKGFLMKLHTGKHFAKPDPSNFQRLLLKRYEERTTEILQRFDDMIISGQQRMK